jgi:hypothetical protein
MFISFGGIIAVYWAVQHVANVDNASVNLADSRQKMLISKNHATHTQKARGPLSSLITLVGSASNNSGAALVLQATISTTKQVTDAKAKWVLPDGVTLVSGSADIVIPLLTPDRPFQTQITVEQKNPGNQQIHFVASGEQPGLHFSSVSQYNTKDEEFLQQQKEEVIKTLNLQKQDRKKAGHMFH